MLQGVFEAVEWWFKLILWCFDRTQISATASFTDEIKERIYLGAGDADVAMVEIGGTVGDIESLPFMEAIRQIGIQKGSEDTLYMHLTLLPYIPTAGELKTKPTQHSVKELHEMQ